MNPRTLVIFPLLLMSSAALTPPYNLTRFSHDSGIFYQNLGSSMVAADYVTLLGFYNMTLLDQELTMVRDAREKCAKIASENLPGNPCNATSLAKIDQSLKDVALQANFFKLHIKQSIKEQTQRGLNGNWLFRRPDAKVVKTLSRFIHQTVLGQAIDQTTSVGQLHILAESKQGFEYSYDLFMRNKETIGTNMNATNVPANVRVEKLTEALRTIDGFLGKLKGELSVMEFIMESERQNERYEKDLIKKAMKTEIAGIKVKPPYKIPFLPNDDELSTPDVLFTVARKGVFVDCKCGLRKGVIIFALQIPLVTDAKFNLYQVLPLPAAPPGSDVYSFVVPKHPYLLIDANKKKYARIDEKSFHSKCVAIAEGEYMCSEVELKSTADEPVCETELLSAPTKLPASCLTRTLKANLELWHNLRPNTWLFTTTRTVPVRISCDDPKHLTDLSKNHRAMTEQTDSLSGTGIITMDSYCVLNTDSSELHGSYVDDWLRLTDYVPQLNITSHDCCADQVNSLRRSVNVKPLEAKNMGFEVLTRPECELGKR